MAGLSVGSLIAYLQVNGATEAAANIGRVQSSMNLAAGSATKLGGAIGESEAALTGAGRASNVAADGSAKLRAAQLSAVAATERYNTVLADENASLGKTASAQAAVIRANERVAAATNTSSAAMRTGAAASAAAGAETATLGSKLGGTVAMLGKLGLAIGAFELVKKAIDVTKEASEFQKQMLLVETQAGATSDEVKSLSKSVLGMAGSVGTSPEELATSLYHVYSVGLKGAQALDAVRIAAEGAKVGNADLEETTNALTATVASGIPGVQNMSKAMGALNTIVGAGDMNLSQLNDALSSGILVVGKQFGLSLTDIGAALATFGDNNIRGAAAATMLRVSITSMAKSVAGGAQQLAEIGMTSDQLAQDMQSGGLNKALVDLSTHLQGIGKGAQISDLSNQISGMKGNIDLNAVAASSLGQTLTTAFGKKAGPGIAILIDQLQRFQTKTEDIEKGANGFGLAWQATAGTASFAFSSLAAEAESAGITLGNKLLPTLTTAATWLATNIPGAIAATQKALLPLEQTVGGVLVSAWNAFSDVLGVVGPALADVGHVLSENGDAIKFVVAPVLAMWAAYKGYEIVTGAAFAVRSAMALMSSSARGNLAEVQFWGAGVQARMTGVATQSGLASLIMQEDFARTAAAALAAAEAEDKAAAVKASSYADEVAASRAATDAQVEAAEEASLAAQMQAKASVAAAAQTAAAAEAAAAAVSEAGDVAAIGWGAMLGPLALVGVGLAAVFGLMHKGASDTAAVTAATQGYTDALNADSDALGAHVRAQAKDNLAKSGAYVAATKMGISQQTLTDAAVGNAAAMDKVTTSIQTYSKANGGLTNTHTALAVGTVTGALDIQNKAIKDSVQQASDKAKADGKSAAAIGQTTAALTGQTAATTDLSQSMAWIVTANGHIQEQMIKTGTDTDISTAAMNAQRVASGLLKTSLDLLNGVALSQEQALDQAATSQNTFVDAMKAAKKAGDAGATSISRNTEAGLQNRENLTSWITALQAAAQAQADTNAKTMSTPDALAAANASLKTNEQHLVDAAVKAGANRQQVQQLVDTLGVLSKVDAQPKIKPPSIAPASAAVKALQAQIDAIKQKAGDEPPLNVKSEGAAAQIKALQAQIDGLEGKTVTVNVNSLSNIPGARGAAGRATGGVISGAGTGTSDTAGIYALSNGEAVIPAKAVSAHPAEVDALIREGRGRAAGGIIGLAGGTSPTYTVNGKKYTTKTAAENAETSLLNTVKTALSSLASAVGGSSADLSAASKSLLKAADAAGASSKSMAKLTAEQSKLVTASAQKDKIAAELGTAPTAETAYDKLATAQGNLANEKDTVSSAFLGSFNIASSGTGPNNDQAPTFNSIFAQAQQQANLATKTAAGEKKLIAEGLDPAYVQQLGEEGTAAWPVVQALLAANSTQIKALSKTHTTIAAQAASIGGSVATDLYGAGVSAAQGLVNGLKSEESNLSKEVSQYVKLIEGGVKSGLGIHSPSTVMHALGEFTGQGFANGITSKHPAVRFATAGLINSAVQLPVSRGPSGGSAMTRWHPDDIQILANLISDRPAVLKIDGKVAARAVNNGNNRLGQRVGR